MTYSQTLSDAAGRSATPASAVDTATITASDGTAIGYRRFGAGKAVIVLHGTMSSSANHTDLAVALAGRYTVIVPDRRGRGMSGPWGADYGLAAEVDDLRRLVAETGARSVVGVSSGGIVALHAALNGAPLDRVAAYEPPLFTDPRLPAATLARFDREMAAGRVAAALTTAMRGAEMGPALLRILPRVLVERMTAAFMARQEGSSAGAYLPMRELAPTLHHDLQLVVEASEVEDDLASVDAEVLLLSGTRSPRYLRAASTRLARLLPRARLVDLPGLDHAASWDRALGGKPDVVAAELSGFLSPGR
jgi:pimeloyl-ACP methyl ester carboxylesterase